MFAKVLASTVLAATLTAAGPSRAIAQSGDSEDRERVMEAVEVLREMTTDDSDIPDELLERAHAIAVVPGVVRGAFIIGGRFGKGLVAARNGAGDWGPPAFVNLGGASYGFQIGADSTDLVMVFVEANGLEALLDDNLELGADASVAAGPIGRSAEIGTNLTFDSPIYAYSRSKGAFAGVALNGAVLSIDDSANEEAYGEPVTGRQILIDRKVSAPAMTEPFLEAVREATRAARTN